MDDDKKDGIFSADKSETEDETELSISELTNRAKQEITSSNGSSEQKKEVKKEEPKASEEEGAKPESNSHVETTQDINKNSNAVKQI